MGVTNKDVKKEVPVESKTAMGQPGGDLPKQFRPPVGTMPTKGIQANKIKRAAPRGGAMTPGIAATAGGQTAAGASSAVPNKKNKEVFGLDPKKWQNVLSKYGIKDL